MGHSTRLIERYVLIFHGFWPSCSASRAPLPAAGPIHASWLTRAWRRHLDSSPIAWLGRRRCERAAVQLLTSDRSIAGIARTVGYPDANYFTRRFRRVFGLAPRCYRAELPIPASHTTRAADWIQW